MLFGNTVQRAPAAMTSWGRLLAPLYRSVHAGSLRAVRRVGRVCGSLAAVFFKAGRANFLRGMDLTRINQESQKSPLEGSVAGP